MFKPQRLNVILKRFFSIFILSEQKIGKTEKWSSSKVRDQNSQNKIKFKELQLALNWLDYFV